MELSYRLYRIATYGPGLSWRWRLNNRSAARLWRMQKVNFWLEGVNGRPRRPSGDVLNKPPWADRNVLECRTATAVERQLRSGSSGSSRPEPVIRLPRMLVPKPPFEVRFTSASAVATFYWAQMVETVKARCLDSFQNTGEMG
jgi:hypothetical protein